MLACIPEDLYINSILYSWKIWRRIKFGSLVVCLHNRQIEIRQNFLLTYTYGDPVPNHQI